MRFRQAIVKGLLQALAFGGGSLVFMGGQIG